MTMTIGTIRTHQSTVPSPDKSNLIGSAHSVQFYGDDTFLVDDISRFIGASLGAGRAAVVIATGEHLRGFALRLKARGVDSDLARTQGRYICLDAADTLSRFMVDGRPDPERFLGVIGGVLACAIAAASGEQPRVAAFGEMVALLWADGNHAAAIELEELWNDLGRKYCFDLRCAYPMSFFGQAGDGGPIETICSAHTHAIPTEAYMGLVSEEDRLQAITLLQQKALALQTEIQERTLAQDELRERNRELREAVAVRDEFLSVAAHELKTPITSLRGFAQLLLRDIQRSGEVAPERLATALGTIEMQTTKLGHLVTRLLDTGQLEAGKLRVEPARTDLAGLVRSALEQQRGLAERDFEYEGPDHLEAIVDAGRFEQVITNLLDNAVKFSSRGSVIAVGLEQAETGEIRLCVTDQGIGIPADQREVVFGRFERAHSHHHLSGMGLGLYIAREIVELHGGSIRIEDPEHPGSRFVVSLPSGSRSVC